MKKTRHIKVEVSFVMTLDEESDGLPRELDFTRVTDFIEAGTAVLHKDWPIRRDWGFFLQKGARLSAKPYFPRGTDADTASVRRSSTPKRRKRALRQP